MQAYIDHKKTVTSARPPNIKSVVYESTQTETQKQAKHLIELAMIYLVSITLRGQA